MAITETCASTTPLHYIWWFPGSPVRVHVDLSVIEELQKRLQDTGRGIAEHGLLFGRVLEGATEILEVQPAGARSVPEMIAELSAEPRKRLLVGYYRTEHGQALRLNDDDLFLFKTFFGKPYHVFLLIQPNAFAAPNATFFFSQGDHRISEFPFLEFPLDASLLATEERDRISRLQQANEQPMAAQHSLPLDAARIPRRTGTLLKIAAGMLLATLLLAAGWIGIPVLRQRSSPVWSAIRKPQPSTPAASYSHPHIGLQVKRQGRDLELTWDRESAWVAAATSGLISIEDGAVKRQISLDSQQLRGESILYSPTSNQIRIELTVTASTGAATESVRVIQGEAIPTHSVSAFRPPADALKPLETPAEPIPAAQPLKPFTPPPIAEPATSPAPPNEAPVLSGNSDSPASPVASFAAPQTLTPPQPAPGATLTEPARKEPSATRTPTEASTTAAYHPPVPITEVQPAFPFELKSVALKPTIVDVQVTIDANGKVLKAEPLHPENIHQLFLREAAHAARLWRFRPALSGDQPVSSEFVVRFTFSR
jgi:outer membrane biosynthesis protein TonB